MKHSILLVDDDQLFTKAMTAFLNGEGFEVTAFNCGYEAIANVRQKINRFSVALIDYNMPDINGAETIKRIKEENEDIIIYGFSGDDSAAAFTDTIGSGGVYVIPKDIKNEKLLGLLFGAVKEFENSTKPLTLDLSEQENIQLINSVGMIGASHALANTAKLIHKYAVLDSTVLIRGENGTGKEKIAKAIHQLSKRNNKKFISINCAAINPNLFESEFFGHIKGAFTGAIKDKKGFFELADGGTLFLDEFGDLPVEMQVKLLRVLQEKIIMPSGSSAEIPVDFRLVIATNRDLEKMQKLDLFREDVYFRISGFTINLAPLKNRKEDIPCLVNYFIERLNIKNSKDKKILNSSVERLKKYDWKGNVRELENFLERLYCESQSDILSREIIKNYIEQENEKNDFVVDLNKAKKQKVADEKAVYAKAIIESETVTDIAKKLDVARSTVREKMKKYGLELTK